MKIVARVLLILVAAAVFVWLASLWAHGVYEPAQGWGRISHRDRWPEMRRWAKFAGECVLFALLAVVGRVVLRLRLTERTQR